MKLRLFFSAELRERVIFPMTGEIAERTEDFDTSATYRTADGSTLIVEWHELLEAEARWRDSLPRATSE